MTQPEFFEHVRLHPDRLNVWYGDIAPPYILQAVSVPVIDNANQNLTNYLTQAEHITIPLLAGGVAVLTITGRQLITNELGTCFYFDIVPTTVSTLTQTTETGANVQVFPAIDQAEFYDNPYNTSYGLIEDERQSTYIMQSDRYKVGTLANPTYTGPLNIDQIISGTAALAHVQDSSYSSTGWTNGRYEGTKTDRLDYKTDPSTAGSLFQGCEFPSSSLSSQIQYLQTNNQVLYKEYFYAGIGDTPGFSAIPSGYILTSSAGITDSQTQIVITPEEFIAYTPAPPKEGDLIRIDDEIMKIYTIGTITIPWLRYTLIVSRGYNSTAASHSNLQFVKKVTPVQIYDIQGNRLTGVPRGQILVKETGAILKLDTLGYVISSSL